MRQGGRGRWAEIGQALTFSTAWTLIVAGPGEEFRTRFKERGTVDLAVGAGTLLVHRVLEGRLDEAERLSSVLVEEGMAPIQMTWTGPQSRRLLLRGSAQAALAVQRERREQISSVASLPNWFDVLDYVEALIANDLMEEALVVARQYATIWQHSDSRWLREASRARPSSPSRLPNAPRQSRDDDLLGQADDLLVRAEAALPDAALAAGREATRSSPEPAARSCSASPLSTPGAAAARPLPRWGPGTPCTPGWAWSGRCSWPANGKSHDCCCPSCGPMPKPWAREASSRRLSAWRSGTASHYLPTSRNRASSTC